MSEDKTVSMPLENQIADFDPTDPDALANLEKQAMGMDESILDVEPEEIQAEAEDTEPPKDGEAEKKAEEDEKKPATADEGDASTTQTPEGVQTRDGKHVIPYRVLEQERDARKTLQQEVERLKADSEKPPGAEGKSTESGGELDTSAIISSEQMEELEDYAPELAGAMKALVGEVNTLKQANTQSELEKKQAEQEKEEQDKQDVQDRIDAAIDGNDDLKAWGQKADAGDSTMWDRAASVDLMLRQDQEWADKPIEERFAKVVETVNAMYGPKETTKPTLSPEQKEADLKKAADEKLEDKPGSMPTSLSDIPGGSSPAQSDIETLENASAVTLGQKFSSMSPDQIESYLARLG